MKTLKDLQEQIDLMVVETPYFGTPDEYIFEKWFKAYKNIVDNGDYNSIDGCNDIIKKINELNKKFS